MTVFDVLVEIFNASLNLFISYLFFKSFWNKKCNNKTACSIFLISTIILTMELLFMKGSPTVFLMLFVATFLLSILFESKFMHKLVFTGIFLCIVSIIENIVALSMSAFLKIQVASVKSGVLYVTGMLFSKFVLYIFVYIIQALKHKPLLGKADIKYWSIFLFPWSSAMVALIQYLIFIDSPEQSTAVSYVILIGYSLLLLANMMIFNIIDALYDKAFFDSKIAMADKIIEAQKVQYSELIESTKQVMKVRHDYKNFCIGLVSELKEGRTEEAIALLQNEFQNNRNLSELSDDILHTVVEIKNKEAKEKGIQLDFEYHALEKLMIPSIDMAVILGNALDNAIEATEKVTIHLKRISLYSAIKNNTAIITIKNPTVEHVDVERLITTKSEINKHGFGIVSMRQLVEKYNGELVFSCEDKVFSVTIVLVNR